VCTNSSDHETLLPVWHAQRSFSRAPPRGRHSCDLDDCGPHSWSSGESADSPFWWVDTQTVPVVGKHAACTSLGPSGHCPQCLRTRASTRRCSSNCWGQGCAGLRNKGVESPAAQIRREELCRRLCREELCRQLRDEELCRRLRNEEVCTRLRNEELCRQPNAGQIPGAVAAGTCQGWWLQAHAGQEYAAARCCEGCSGLCQMLDSTARHPTGHS
jgi:hypothetical protein